jgi:hypothetical protein
MEFKTPIFLMILLFLQEQWRHSKPPPSTPRMKGEHFPPPKHRMYLTRL